MKKQNRKTDVKYSYYDSANRRNRLVNTKEEIPAHIAAFPLYLGNDGIYYSIPGAWIYNGQPYWERHDEYVVEATANDWRYFKSERAAQQFINEMAKCPTNS